MYMFSEPLAAPVVHALYELGPSYHYAFDDADAVDAFVGYEELFRLRFLMGMKSLLQ